MASFLKKILHIFRERGQGRGREPSLGCLLYTPQLGIELVTQACALSRN